MAISFYRHYVALVEDIERNFPVAQWQCGDVDVWPLARLDLYLDMYWNGMGQRPAPRAFGLRLAGHTLRPLRNLWKSRRDLGHCLLRPRPAHAVMLGDGVSLDWVGGAWRDRFGEPLIAALEEQGHDTFLMQAGDLSRLPWARPTFAANVAASKGWLNGLAVRRPAQLPDHARVLQYLSDNSISAPSLTISTLTARANEVAATAATFEQILRRVRPKLAFVITSFAGLGPAFVLACRRQGILSVDLQRGPLAGAPMAYSWVGVPERGYTTMPSVFWTWNSQDAGRINDRFRGLALPWHRALHGGHAQVAPFLDDHDPVTRDWDTKLYALGPRREREVLIALQPLGGHRALWDALAAQIEAAPPNWRWWIRRHPASRPEQDGEFGRLLTLAAANVVTGPLLPLPALLRHMSVMLSLGSGATCEAEYFGVPAFFLSEDARQSFGDLVTRGAARIVAPDTVNSEIARLPGKPIRAAAASQPDLRKTLRELEKVAADYVSWSKP